ncbi:diacylglycerol kinase family protein [Novosphingobium sp. P6W]|uniref:diacylglycerol/lipid kinase family protein n=1 Tax=Novosphingobium sp. P6W TaxID=1609758 RepID=UPI0005C329A9|nr:diacylglycerol kinase family protein [Novosphingobium sp. P6W]AXB79920.1 diacylglycerol kinase [Novosphingobium sp. P6W]KIS30449.1 diacylglycerol kinase [Novosphingobium sp. P6W]
MDIRKKPRALIVHNENAGTDPVPRAHIERVLREAGFDTIYCAHGEEDLEQALSAEFDFVIAAGGDGTVSHVVSLLDNGKRPIGVLPLGGSNNIAHALGIEGDWRNIPRRWSLSNWTLLDRCEAHGPWGHKQFVEAVGAGVLTQSFDDVDGEPDTAEEKRGNGRAAFRTALQEATTFRCCVKADGWEWAGDCLMVEVMSIPLAGPRLRLGCHADPGDGLLDVVIVTSADRNEMLAWAEDPDDQPCPIKPLQAPCLKLTVEQRPFRVDDRCPDQGVFGSVDIRVRSGPVRILVPQENYR